MEQNEDVPQSPQPKYDANREDKAQAETLGTLRGEVEKGGIPNPKAIKKQISNLKKRIKTLENGLATSSEENVQKGFDALATLNGQLHAYEQFLSDVNGKIKEAERNDKQAAEPKPAAEAEATPKAYKELGEKDGSGDGLTPIQESNESSAADLSALTPTSPDAEGSEPVAEKQEASELNGLPEHKE